MYFVGLLEGVAAIISMETHLKDVLGFTYEFDPEFLFIVEILHDAKNGSGYILIPMSCQTFSVSPDISYFLDMCPNI